LPEGLRGTSPAAAARLPSPPHPERALGVGAQPRLRSALRVAAARHARAFIRTWPNVAATGLYGAWVARRQRRSIALPQKNAKAPAHRRARGAGAGALGKALGLRMGS